MPNRETLSHLQAKCFYDRMAAIQDAQYFLERAALTDLVANLEPASAERWIEFGCGTGRFIEELFVRYLPLNACYIGFDVSGTMIELALSRTARFGGRAVIRQTDGAMYVDLPDRSFDRFISTYVLDLLSEENIDSLLSEAYRNPPDRGSAGPGQPDQRITRPIALRDADLGTAISILADPYGRMSTDHNRIPIEKL